MCRIEFHMFGCSRVELILRSKIDFTVAFESKRNCKNLYHFTFNSIITRIIFTKSILAESVFFTVELNTSVSSYVRNVMNYIG